MTYDFIIGTRNIYALQNYSKYEPVYDENAYTYNSTYYTGTNIFQLYICYMIASIAEKPKYHITQLKSYIITNIRKTYIERINALKNLKDLAKDYRSDFIQIANTKAQQSG